MGLGHKEERRMTHQTEDEGTTILLKRRETPVQRNSVTCYIPTNYREITFSFVLWVTCAQAQCAHRRKVIVRYVMLPRLCRTSCYRQMAWRDAATSVITVDSTESDCSMVLREYCELCNLGWLCILYNVQLHCSLGRASRATILSEGRLSS
jgi:hypothetical protein